MKKKVKEESGKVKKEVKEEDDEEMVRVRSGLARDKADIRSTNGGSKAKTMDR